MKQSNLDDIKKRARELGENGLTAAADCYRSENKFKQDGLIVPLGYTEAQMRWSDGFSDGYKFHLKETSWASDTIVDLVAEIETLREKLTAFKSSPGEINQDVQKAFTKEQSRAESYKTKYDQLRVMGTLMLSALKSAKGFVDSHDRVGMTKAKVSEVIDKASKVIK